MTDLINLSTNGIGSLSNLLRAPIVPPSVGQLTNGRKISSPAQVKGELLDLRHLQVGGANQHIVPINTALEHLRGLKQKRMQVVEQNSGFWGFLAKRIIFPAMFYYDREPNRLAAKAQREAFFADPNNVCCSLLVKTINGDLDGAIVWSDKSSEKTFKENPKKSKWLFFLNGNKGCYEFNLMRARQYSEWIGCNVVMVNPRGVMRSTGTSETLQEIVEDFDLVVQHLKKSGVPAKNIAFWGYSLGGGVATALAGNNPGTMLVNERSFSSISSIFCSWWKMMDSTVHPRLIKITMQFILRKIGWELDSEKNLQKMDPSQVKVVITATKDPMMRGEGQLQSTINSKDQAPDATVLSLEDQKADHNSTLTPRVNAKVILLLREAMSEEDTPPSAKGG